MSPRRPSSMSNTTKRLSVLLKVTPIPTRLSESRSILRHLTAQLGRPSYFYEGRHSNPGTSTNYIFTIFPTESSYQKALASSPMFIPTDSPPLSQDPIKTSSSFLGPRRKTFRCDLLPSNIDHDKSVASNPFRGPYDIHRENITYQTLRHVGAPQPAIADFQLKHRQLFITRRKDQLLRMVQMEEGGLMGMWRRATRGKKTTAAAAAAASGGQGRDWGALDLEGEMEEAKDLVDEEEQSTRATTETTEDHEPR